MADVNKIVVKPLSARQIIVKAGPITLNGAVTWDHLVGKPTEFPPSPHSHETAKIGDYRPDRDYAVGDTIYYEGHIWRAIKHGFLLPPDKPQGTALVYFNAPGFSKNPYRVTEVAPAPPAGIPHTPFDMHLEYISDTNFHLYKPFGPTWQKITGITIKVWRSEGVPAIPFPNHATMWIYSAPDTSPAPVAGQNDWTSLKFNEYLSGLSDCAFESMPHPGQSLVYNGGIHRWVPGTPAFKVPDHSITVSYSPGDTVYWQGQFWRNIWTSGQNLGIRPEMTPSGAVGFFRHGGLNIGPIMAEFVEVGDPSVAPTGQVAAPLGKHYALKWQSDASWSVWEWAVIGHNPTVWGWKQVALAHVKTWRNFALPSPVTEEDTGQLWIYAAPGTTTPPVVPQRHWEPVPLGDFLVSMADVDAINAKTGDTLVYDGHGKWVATGISGGLTQADADLRYVQKSVGGSYITVYDGDILLGTPKASVEVQDNYIQLQKTLVGDAGHPAIGGAAGISITEAWSGNNTKAHVEFMGSIDQYHWTDGSVLSRKYADGRYASKASGTANVTLDTPATVTSLTGSAVGYNGFQWLDPTGNQQSVMGLTGAGDSTATTPTMRYARNASGFTTLACITTGGLGSVSIQALRKNQGTETNISGGCITVSGTSGVTIDGSASNMTEKTSLVINSTGLKVTTTGNATTWTASSLLTQGYADTRYVQSNATGPVTIKSSDYVGAIGSSDAYLLSGDATTGYAKISAYSGSNARNVAMASLPNSSAASSFTHSPTGVTYTQHLGTTNWADNSLITRAYADTRYLPSSTSESLSVLVNSGNGTYSRFDLEKTGGIGLNASNAGGQTRLNLSPDQGVTLTLPANVAMGGHSVLTRDYADSRYAPKVASAIPGVIEVDAGNGKTLVFTDGVLTEVRTTP